MRVAVLGSGSSGNSVLVCSGGTNLLIDAGFSARAMAERLEILGVEPDAEHELRHFVAVQKLDFPLVADEPLPIAIDVDLERRNRRRGRAGTSQRARLERAGAR